jgi:hypothetical protein
MKKTELYTVLMRGQSILYLKFKCYRTEPTFETSYILNISQTMDNVQRNFSVMNQPFSQTFRESQDILSLFDLFDYVYLKPTLMRLHTHLGGTCTPGSESSIKMSIKPCQIGRLGNERKTRSD